MNYLFSLFFIFWVNVSASSQIIVGAERMDHYMNSLKRKKVAVFANQTSRFPNGTHLIDSLLSRKVKITKIFTPEHGFKGNIDAGELIGDHADNHTNIQIISLYGDKKEPNKKDMQGIDVVIIDIQDVGVRFYTYISSLEYIMRTCMIEGKTLIVLDRPNPNGYYVDGPVLDTNFRSFVGMQPVPMVYGMTIGEYAQMIYKESWVLKKEHISKKFRLTIIPCKGYEHKMKYSLPIAPSPNLKSDIAVQLYPTLCLFEGTPISVGRGTPKAFEIFGHPSLNKGNFPYTFIPTPNEGNKTPLYEGKICYGKNMEGFSSDRRIHIEWIMDVYKRFTEKEPFFLPPTTESPLMRFDKLAGNNMLRKQIIDGVDEETIRKSWQNDIKAFLQIRKNYLLYPDFE